MRDPVKEKKEINKLQLRIDSIITVMFLITICVFGVMTVAQDFDAFHNAYGSRNKLKAYLPDPENYSQWDFLAARIKSVDAYIAESAYLAKPLGYLNSSLQYAMGKRLVATGSTQMLTLNTGHLYDLQSYVPMDGSVNDIKAMRDICGDTPFMFVYEHPTIYSPNQMPDEYACLDHAAEMADELIADLQAENINYIDSRETLTASGLELTDYLMVTDQHWSTRAAIVMSQRIAEEITKVTGVELDTTRIDIDNLDSQTYEKLFLGKYGQRIGTGNVDPDDITIYWPKYDTNIHRYTKYLQDTFDLNGAFYDSVIRWKYLTPDAGKTWNIKAYYDYGLTENYDIFENEDGGNVAILLLKDSYSAPMGSFLALMANKVVAVDLRRSDYTLSELLETYQPDVVVQAYSLQMMKQDEYEFQ